MRMHARLHCQVLFTLGPSLIDLMSPQSKIAMYLGVFYALAAIGPALGFFISSQLLAIW